MPQRSVAILDDEPAFRRFAGGLAQSCGYKTYDTANPTMFEDYVSTTHPTAAIIELAMVGRDGVEVINRLSRRATDTPLIIASRVDDRILQTARRFAEARGLRVAGAVHKLVAAHDLRAALALADTDSETPTAPELIGAMARDELLPLYQPLLDLRTHRVVGVEALARWQHARRGLLAPASFIPLAEESALIDSLTEAIFTKAVAQLAIWRAGGLDLRCSVNFSARTIRNDALADSMIAACHDHRVEPQRLTLELTESATTSESAGLRESLAQLRSHGFGIAIDDFGTGFSSLARLQELPFTEVKLDRTFVAGMRSSRESRIIVKSTIDMAHELGLSVVAEGIETTPLLLRLAAQGCDAGQGYGISRPLEAARVPEFAATFRYPASCLAGARA